MTDVQTRTPAQLAAASLGNKGVARRARYRAEDVTFLAEQGADLHEVCRRMGFPSREALATFCRRQGIQSTYHRLARNDARKFNWRNQYLSADMVC